MSVGGKRQDLVEDFVFLILIYFLEDFIFILERGERGKEERKSGSVASNMPLTGDLACDPGMCPDRESSLQPFALWEDTQLTEPRWSGAILMHFKKKNDHF